MGIQSISSSYLVHTTKPAPVIAADFIKDHYYPNNTIIYASESFRHFQYYLPSFVVKNYQFVTQGEIDRDIRNNTTIVSEHDPIIINNYDVNVFNRSSEIYPKHEQVILSENKLNQDKDAIVLDRDGWHGLEKWGGVNTWWLEDSANVYIYSPNNSSALLEFRALSFCRNRTLQVSSGNDIVVIQKVPINFVNVTMPINLVAGANQVQMKVLEGCEFPRDKLGPSNLDSRCLSVAIQLMTVKPNNFSVPDYNSGFYNQENWSGYPSRWMDSKGTLVVYSFENCTANLCFQALSFYQSRNLHVYSEDKLESNIAVPTSFINVCIPIYLAKGANILHLCVPEGCERPSDKPELNSPDSRCLSLNLRNVSIIRKPR
jgi:hypothetical protein